jgi:hypothetical protein
MKKLNLLYAIALTALAISCGKDDEDPTYKKADLIGTWEQTATTVPDDGSNDDCTTSKEEVQFTETKMTFISTCDDSSGSIELDYAFDNKRTVTFELIADGKMVIQQLNSTTLKVDAFYNGQKAGTVTYKKE